MPRLNPFLTAEYKRLTDWCLGLDNHDRADKLSTEVTLPRFPLLSAILIFLSVPSVCIGNTIPWIIMGSVVLLDVRWWATCLRYSFIWRHPLRLLLFAIYISSFISGLLSPDLAYSAKIIFFYSFVLYFVLGSHVLLTRLDFRIWRPWLLRIMLGYGVFMALRVIAFPLSEYGSILGNRVGDLRSASWVLICLFPALFLTNKRPWEKTLSILIFVALCIFSIHIENRASIIGLTTIINVLIWHCRARFKWWTLPLMLFTTGAAVLLVSYGFQGKYQTFVDMPGEIFAPTWLIDPYRQVIWDFVWGYLPDTPPFGFGIRGGRFLPGANIPIPWALPNVVPVMEASPHNIFLEWYLELGWIGFGLIMLAYTLKLLFLIRRRDSFYMPEWMLHGAFFGISFFNTSFWQFWWFSGYFLSFIIILALTSHARRQAKL